MDEWSLLARRRFVAECACIGMVALLWLAYLVLGVGGPQATQAISNFGLIAAAASAGLACLATARHRPTGADVEAAGDLSPVLGQRAGSLDLAKAEKTATPTATQRFPPATGLGSVELARGTSHLTDGTVELRGEQDIFGAAFDSRSWAAKSLAGTSWTGGAFNGSTWTGTTWSGHMWSTGLHS